MTAPADGPDRRRLAALALGAIAILTVGALLRPSDATVEPPISLTESATLQALSRRETFQDMAEFAAERMGMVERYLVYLPGPDRSGVRWGSPDSAVTVGADSLPLERVETPPGDVGVAATPGTAVQLTGPRWVLIAGRQGEGGLATSVGISGGVVRLACWERRQPALLLSVPLSRPLAGAGVFDLDGVLLAVVGRCGPGYAAIPVTEIDAALRTAEAPPARVHGMELVELDSLARRQFRADSGALIRAVELDGAGARAGLRPGDVILDPAALAAAPDSLPPELTVLRGGRTVRPRPMPDTAAEGGLGLVLVPPAEGIEIADVAAGSPADRAGLRPGDRIVRLGGLERPSRELVGRALRGGGAEGEPLYLVYRRGRDERGTFLLP